MMSRGTIAGLVLLLPLAACGGSGDGPESAAAPSGDATTSSPAASDGGEPTEAPSYTESETCRTEMQPILEVMQANAEDTSLGFTSFETRNERLTREIDDALTACSESVSGPARKVMYEYAMVYAQWLTCGEGDRKCTKRIEEGLSSAELETAKLDLALNT